LWLRVSAIRFVDHIGAIIVALFIFKVTWDIIKPAFVILVDSGASRRETDEIARIARGTQGVRSVHRIRSRKMAESYFVDLHVLVDPELSVRIGHDISEDVKHRLLQQGPSIVDVVVHLEPWKGRSRRG
jgi:cation diffusion facilitator family transporter